MSDLGSSFGIHQNQLYETIAITFADLKDGVSYIPNCACMGVRFIDEETFQMTPFLATDTYQNLFNFPYVSINFVNNMYLYAKAALIGENAGPNEPEFSESNFDHKMIKLLINEGQGEEEFKWLFLKESWGTVLGKLGKRQKIVKRDQFGENKALLCEFKVIDFLKRNESFNLINRSNNLALEIIILTTRLKIAKNFDKKQIYDDIFNKITFYKREIERFCQNDNLLKTLDFVTNYIEEKVKW